MSIVLLFNLIAKKHVVIAEGEHHLCIKIMHAILSASKKYIIAFSCTEFSNPYSVVLYQDIELQRKKIDLLIHNLKKRILSTELFLCKLLDCSLVYKFM